MTNASLFDPNLGEFTTTLSTPLPSAPDNFLSALKPPTAPIKEKIRQIKGVVVKAEQETPDTWTLHIFVGESDRRYTAGQFISIAPQQFPELANMVAYMEHVKGRKELVRAYSMASAPHEPYVSITTKPEHFEPNETLYPPLLSPLLASNFLVGREIEFLGYTGAYTLKPDHGVDTDQVLHIVAGSGAVPNFALLKDELINNKNPNVMHTMIDVNRTVEDIIYRQALDDLAKQFPQRFQLIHLLTRDEHPARHGPQYFKGRPTLDFVQRFVKNPQRLLVYSCGAGITKWQRKKAIDEGREPQPRFLETVHDIVQGLGLDKKRFKREIYG